MASFLYDSFIHDVISGAIDLDTDTFKLMLCTSTYTPSKSGHDRRNDITNEVSGTNYTAGGAAATVTLTAAAGNSDIELINIADVSWASSTITARYGVLYKSRGGASSSDELVALLDFGADKVSTGGTFTVHMTTQFGINNA